MTKADLILKNGKVYSFSVDGARQDGTAVVVANGKILDVCDDAKALRYGGEDTEIIDCGRNTILPGLSDAHAHPSSAASIFESCQLFDITGASHESSQMVIDRYLKRLKAYIASHQEERVIRATGWNRAFFSGACKDPKWPDRHDLDQLCADRPIVMESYCQHAMWVNTKALELAGISEKTPEPVSGTIRRDESGHPTGILLELDALNLIKENLPGYDFSVPQYKNTILRYQNEEALPYGVTLLHDCMHTENAKSAYKELAAEGKLKVRVRGVYPFSNCRHLEELDEIKAKAGTDHINDTFDIQTIKIFLEGEFAMIESYEEGHIREHGLPSGYDGELFYTDEEAERAIVKAAELGLQIHIHAMGDKAVKQAVDCLVSAQNQTGTANRNTIAHLTMVRNEDMTRMAQNHIICNCQPRWMINDSDTAEYYTSCFGRKRAMEAYPHKRLIDAGCLVAYGTDFPVTPPPNPFHEIQCALTRSVFPEDEEEYKVYQGTVLGPADDPYRDCVSMDETIKGLTCNAAYQLFVENATGSIEKGKSAELVVLDRDLEETAAEEIYKTQVALTVFKGDVVYRKTPQE